MKKYKSLSEFVRDNSPEGLEVKEKLFKKICRQVTAEQKAIIEKAKALK